MKKILLTGGTVVTSQKKYKADILISNGKIEKIIMAGKKDAKEENETKNVQKIFRLGGKGEEKNVQKINCSGKFILPGFIDAHVHMREPGESYKEDWKSGSKSALVSGITTVLDMPNNKPPILTVADLKKKEKIILGRSYVNFGLFMGYNGKNFSEINKAKNIAGVKIYAAHSTGNLGVESDDLVKIFQKLKKLLVIHAEDFGIVESNLEKYKKMKGNLSPDIHSKIRSRESILTAVKKIMALAKKYKIRVHIAHISMKEELLEIKKVKGVTCEVSPHHLFFTEKDYKKLGNLVKINPPLRTKADCRFLLNALAKRAIDIVATDHAPHLLIEKKKKYLDCPSGVPELETMGGFLFDLVNRRKLKLEDLAYLCSERPAEIFGIKKRGKIKEDFFADLIVVDMKKRRKIENKKLMSKCGWSPYVNHVFRGLIELVIVNGDLIFNQGEAKGKLLGRNVF